MALTRAPLFLGSDAPGAHHDSLEVLKLQIVNQLVDLVYRKGALRSHNESLICILAGTAFHEQLGQALLSSQHEKDKLVFGVKP